MLLDRLALADQLRESVDAGLHAEASVLEAGGGQDWYQVRREVVRARLNGKGALRVEPGRPDRVAHVHDALGLEAEVVVVEYDLGLAVSIDEDVELLDDPLRRLVPIRGSGKHALAAVGALVRAAAGRRDEAHVVLRVVKQLVRER